MEETVVATAVLDVRKIVLQISTHVCTQVLKLRYVHQTIKSHMFCLFNKILLQAFGSQDQMYVANYKPK